MDDDPQRFYEFDRFLLDARERLLFLDGEPLDLTPKVFDLLLELVRNSGRVVGKNELMEKVWPDSFVEENNLTQHVSTLRKKLAQHSDRQRYILTVPGRGYRFVAGVRGWDDDAVVTVHERVRTRVVRAVDEDDGGAEALRELEEGAGDAAIVSGEPQVKIVAQRPARALALPEARGDARGRRGWLISGAALVVVALAAFGLYQ